MGIKLLRTIQKGQVSMSEWVMSTWDSQVCQVSWSECINNMLHSRIGDLNVSIFADNNQIADLNASLSILFMQTVARVAQ